MDSPQSDSDETRPGETQPSDPDLKWTGWALGMLRETVEIDMRAKRLAVQQQATPAESDKLDFPLMQSRLSRSIRLSIAMTERIRADYLMRRDGRAASGAQERRRQRRDQATDAMVRAVALPEVAGDAERLRSMVRETLVEDEILDAQIDSLSPDEFVQAVCRKIGFPPPSIPLPQAWDDGADDDAGPDAADIPAVASGDAAGRGPAAARPHPANDSGRPIPGPPQPDSS
jgi:hypothetical protein